MRRFVSLFAVICAALLFVGATPAQTVTEDNLLRMVNGKVPEAFIVKAISMAKTIEVNTDFENLPALLGKGLSQAVVNALVERKATLESKSAITTPVVSVTMPMTPSLTSSAICPSESGAFYHSPTGWVKMQGGSVQNKSRGMMKLAFTPLGMGKMSQKWTFEGREAELKTNPKPEFCVVEPGVSPRAVKIVELDQRKEHRDTEASASGLIVGGMRSGLRKNKLQAVVVERVAEGVVHLKVEQSLDEGEYALTVQDKPQYDFSVRTASPSQVASNQ